MSRTFCSLCGRFIEKSEYDLRTQRLLSLLESVLPLNRPGVMYAGSIICPVCNHIAIFTLQATVHVANLHALKIKGAGALSIDNGQLKMLYGEKAREAIIFSNPCIAEL